IAQGSLNKWFKESTLLNQIYVKDGKISIKEFLAQKDKELTVVEFDRFTLNV
ncbi:MAG: elongation factor Ts, partial [Mariniphaga sp.]|nr:elongation factor Ts [Mariniphaga sp.]